MQELGLGTASVAEAQEFATGPEFSVVTPFYFPGSEKWVDVRFEFDRRGAHGTCRSLLKRGANSPQELQDVLVELVHLLSSIRSMDALKADGGMLAFAASPVISPGTATELNRRSTKSYRLQAGDIRTNVTEFLTEAKIITKLTEVLKPGDIVIDRVGSPADPEMALASPGDVMTRGRISNLSVEAAGVKMRVVSIPESSSPYLTIGF